MKENVSVMIINGALTPDYSELIMKSTNKAITSANESGYALVSITPATNPAYTMLILHFRKETV